MKRSLRKIKRRIVKSFRDIAILAVLKESELNGYEVMEQLYENHGILLPSGTVYATLYALEREQLISGVSHSKCRTYSLTSKGQAELDQADEMIRAFNMFMNKLYGKSLSIQH